MAHFAELDETNTVLRVIVVDNNDCLNAEGQEDEAVGVAFCTALLGGNWVQTSYNGNKRARYAGVGYMYDAVRDVFLTPKPFPSWTLDEATTTWVAPVPMPTPGRWEWDETAGEWRPI
jgi:hypothetical protein